MLIHETLFLFTGIRYFWESKKFSLLAQTLFIKDGPLSLHGQYSKLVIPIREFFEYAKNNSIKNLNYDFDLSYSFEENKSAIPSKRLIDSFNNINKKNKLMVFDLETISVTDVNNKIKLSQITDFTFSLFDAKTKKETKTYD